MNMRMMGTWMVVPLAALVIGMMAAAPAVGAEPAAAAVDAKVDLWDFAPSCRVNESRRTRLPASAKVTPRTLDRAQVGGPNRELLWAHGKQDFWTTACPVPLRILGTPSGDPCTYLDMLKPGDRLLVRPAGAGYRAAVLRDSQPHYTMTLKPIHDESGAHVMWLAGTLDGQDDRQAYVMFGDRRTGDAQEKFYWLEIFARADAKCDAHRPSESHACETSAAGCGQNAVVKGVAEVEAIDQGDVGGGYEPPEK